MTLNRRQFLNQATLALMGLGGLSLLDVKQKFAALASPAPRKLALLVGINNYGKGVEPLHGCLTDLELQQELLVHRCGFNPSDIVVLKDQDATRENIETIFKEHLVQNCTKDDLALFHFSGYGSEVSFNGSPIAALTPFDGILKTGDAYVDNQLLMSTLRLLGEALATNRFTAIIDAGSQRGSSPSFGNQEFLTHRVYPFELKGETNADELALQTQLKIKARNLKNESLGKNRSVIKAEGNTSGIEIKYRGFNVGLLTYSLTQTLWETLPGTTNYWTFGEVSDRLNFLSKGQEQLNFATINKSSLPYQGSLVFPPRAAGYVKQVDSNFKTITLFAGGLLPALTIENLFPSVVKLGSGAEAIITAREGFNLKGKIVAGEENKIKVGEPWQEKIRSMPKRLELNISLDPDLSRIERVDAASGFSNLDQVSATLLGEDPAASDYVLAKIANTDNYGLFDWAQRLVSDPARTEGLAIKAAVNQLQKTMQGLLAAKLWHFLANPHNDNFAIEGRVLLQGTDQTKGKVLKYYRTNPLGTVIKGGETKVNEQNYEIHKGERVQWELNNKGKANLYVNFLAYGPKGVFMALHNPEQQSNLEIPAQTSVQLLGDGLKLSDDGPSQLLVIVTQQPLPQVDQTIKYVSRTDDLQMMAISNPLAVTIALLESLHHLGQSSEEQEMTLERYELAIDNWVGFDLNLMVQS